MTKLDVYDKFIQELPAFGPDRFKASEAYWYSIWRQNFKWLKCPKICKFSECKICSTAKLHKQVAPAEMRGMLERKPTLVHERYVQKENTACSYT